VGTLVVVHVVAACTSATATPRATPSPVVSESTAPLARFMREMVNVPYSFALIENDRSRRVHRAAIVLKEAARDLVHWSDIPLDSASAREVFHAYAQSLEYHVGRLETATRNHDPRQSAESMEDIRQTCNDCHRFFRPASLFSRDVAFDVLSSRLEAQR